MSEKLKHPYDGKMIKVPHETHARLKIIAAIQGVTMGKVISDFVSEFNISVK